jgi:oxygen-independent coproporphyrinogen-3 oxidase
MFTHLYIHIPFCFRKCPYCAFFSQEPTRDDLDCYFNLLRDEMLIRSTAISSHSEVTSIYFGGGTPSLMKPHQIGGLLECAGKHFNIGSSAEITLEANPGTIDLHRLADFRQAGINRLSLGIQSFDDRMLTTLGRIHTSQQSLQAFEDARTAGFDNIGIDLINSLPGQTAEMWQSELEQAIELTPEHLSVYGLTIEEDTPFATKYANSTQVPDQDQSADMFETADNLLTSRGYEHYEIANYALPGRRSVHNSGYWHRDGYLGLGAGAHSLLKDDGFGTRRCNISNLDAYSTALQNGCLAEDEVMSLAYDDAVAEIMFLGLRMADGVSFCGFRDSFGRELKDVFGQQIADLAAKGLITEHSSGIKLTRRGMLLSNQVFQQFLA